MSLLVVSPPFLEGYANVKPRELTSVSHRVICRSSFPPPEEAELVQEVEQKLLLPLPLRKYEGL